MNPGLLARKALLSLAMTILFSTLYAQTETGDQTKQYRNAPHETRGDDYAASPRSGHPTSSAYTYSAPGFFTTQVNVNANGENVVGDAANEPSITFDPNDHSKMAIGWRHFETITNNFRQAGIAFTTDGGQIWTFPEVIDPGVFRSDPVLDSDAEGNFYYNSLTVSGWDYSCDVFKSADGGQTWDAGAFAQGGDKQWMAVDKTGGQGDGHVYAFWTSSWSICYPDFFTRSVDGGSSYQPCTSIPGNPYWGTLAVGPGGELYLAGSKGYNFMFAKSLNAQDPSQTTSWDLVSDVDLDGEIMGFAGYNSPNPEGLLGQTIIAVDSSGGTTHGNIYILCSVDRYTGGDPCDVMFTRSTDHGESWSVPVRVNDDQGASAYQWFGTMSVAPDGRIDAVWLDTRDNPGSVWSALYYSWSMDGGGSWSENVKLSESFNPHMGWPSQDKMGDYFDMYSDETGAHLAWAGTFNGEQDVYYAHITDAITGEEYAQAANSPKLCQNYPNPFSEYTSIRFRLHESMHVRLSVFDLTGREVDVLVDDQLAPGLHTVRFDPGELENGIYGYRLKGNGLELARTMVLYR